MTVAGAIANLGIGVTLVERDCRLGGHAANWACMATEECARCSACLVEDQISQISAHPEIEILLGARLGACQGEAGGFQVTLEPDPAFRNAPESLGIRVSRDGKATLRIRGTPTAPILR